MTKWKKPTLKPWRLQDFEGDPHRIVYGPTRGAMSIHLAAVVAAQREERFGAQTRRQAAERQEDDQ